jgi:nitrate reductase beta subunit
MLAARQTSDTMAAPGNKAQRVNLLNWDGKSAPAGLFPPRPEDAAGVAPGDAGSVEPRP